MRILTLAYRTQLPAARVLAESLRRLHPDWSLEVVLLGPREAVPQRDEPFAISAVTERLGLNAEQLFAKHESADLRRWLVAELLTQELAAHGGPVLHLPPGAWALNELSSMAEALERDGILLVTRCSRDLPHDDLEPTPAQLASAGRVSPELIGVAPSAAADEFLQRWRAQLDEVPGSDAMGVAHVSLDWNRWLGQALELSAIQAGARITGPDQLLSEWNAWSASVEIDADRRFTVDGQPLRLVDLSGYEPDRPYRLGPHASRSRLSRGDALRELTDYYRDELLAAGWDDFTQRAAIGRKLTDGTIFDERMWRLRAVAYELAADFGDVFTEEGTRAFQRWLASEANGELMPGISRYIAYAVIAGRSDLFEVFDPVDGTNPDFIAWCHLYGREELDVPEWCLPAHPEQIRQSSAHSEAPEGDSGPDAPFSARLSGYLTHVLGVGSAARGYAAALETAGIPVELVSVKLDHPELPDATTAGTTPGRNGGGPSRWVELVGINPDELPGFVESVDGDYPRGPRVGLWAWEADAIPSHWHKTFQYVDEIWVHSQYTTDVLSPLSPVPVKPMALPVEAPVLRTAPHRLEIPDGFLFLFMFDYFSTIQRKNPVGLIEAFKKAFAPGEGPRLLIKTINGDRTAEAQEAVLYAAGDRLDIHVVDRSLSGEEKSALIAGCDCYVSLHRSEGFGLTMAEAMAIGKPVIGTGYSGNLDFMDADNSFLVDYELVNVGPECPIYPAFGRWADPDTDHAARLMRQVYENPEAAAAVGAHARTHIARKLSLKARGQDMRRRLEEILEI